MFRKTWSSNSMQRNLIAFQQVTTMFGNRRFLLGGLGYWLLMLGLSLIQAGNETVIWTTPYGRYFLGNLIIPILGLIIFFIIALFRQDDSTDSPLGNNLPLQIFLLVLILLMTYWALRSLLLANWLLLLGVWLILPLLYLGGVSIVGQNTLVSLGSIVLVLVGLELFLQAAPGIWPPTIRDSNSNWRRIHADIPFHVDESETIAYRINELGFRGTTPVPSQVDMVTLGDSFTFGLGSASPWTERTAQILKWQVLNLGASGASPPTQIPPLIEYGLPRQPRVVIYAYFEGNDFYPCNQPARSQGARWGDKVVTPDLLRIVELQVSRLFSPPSITSELNYNVVTPLQAMFNQQPVDLTFAPAYVATLTLDKSRLRTSENWRIVSRNLLRMRDLVEAKDAMFILVYIPEQARVYWPLVRENPDMVSRMYNDLTYRWVTDKNCLKLTGGRSAFDEMAFKEELDITVDEQQNLMAAFAAESDIFFLDLTEPLRTHAAQGTVLASFLDTHYNDYANQVIGAVIADYITSHLDDKE